MTSDRFEGGLWCHEVLAVLSQHLDGELAPDARASVVAHVTACDACARFGDRFARAIDALRREAPAPAVPDDVRTRLARRLRDAAG